MNEDMDALIEVTQRYYSGLIERGIPHDLATRIVGDWYSGCVTIALTYFENRLRDSAEVLTKRLVRQLSRPDA